MKDGYFLSWLLRRVVIFSIFCASFCGAGSDPCSPTAGDGLSTDDEINLCQSDVPFPVEITRPVESVNISTTDEFAVFSCEAVGSSILSLEWRVLANRSLSELGARVATQGGNNSICSNLTLSVAVLYELSSQAPLKVICNVSQTSVLPAGTGTVHTYIISEGYIFFLLTPSLRAALPEGTLSLDATPTGNSPTPVANPGTNSFESSGSDDANLPLIVSISMSVFVLFCICGILLLIIAVKCRRHKHSSTTVKLVKGSSIPEDSTVVSLPIHKESPGPIDESMCTTVTHVGQPAFSTIHETYQNTHCQCTSDVKAWSRSYMLSRLGDRGLNAMQTEVDIVPPLQHCSLSLREPQAVTTECRLPDCMCQASQCRYYESLYAPPSATYAWREMTSKKAADTFPKTSSSTTSLASIANGEHCLRQPDRPASFSSMLSDESDCDEEATSSLREIESYGFGSSFHSHIPFLGPTTFIKCDSSGGVYHDPVHDFSVRIPETAVPEGASITIEIGVMLSGPFQFPTDLKPVSPIVWLCVRNQENFEFVKPVQIILPHYLHIASQDDLNRLQLTFLKAKHAVSDNSLYQFTQAEGTATIEVQSTQGTLSTKHFCFLCIAAKLSPEDTDKVNYCLVQVQPCTLETSSWMVYFCVAYFLQTCIECIKKQYPPGYKVTTKSKFRFTGSGDEAKLSISFPREVPGGWTLALGSDCKISASEVDFWNIEQKELELMHQEAMYPPRFSVEIAAEEVARNTTAGFHFSGAQENLDVQIILKPPVTTAVVRRPPPAATSTVSLPTDASLTPPPYRPNGYMYCPPYMQRSPEQFHFARPAIGWGSSSFLPEDYPTNEELQEVTSEVMGKLQHDWTKLQAYLSVPDDAMLEIHCQSTIRQKVSLMLSMWRDRSEDGSRSRLADCLKAADQRLHKTADNLLTGKYRTLSMTRSSSNSTSSSGNSLTRGAIRWSLESHESFV